ncbi:protein phosphatase CheZ [Azospirillum sp.]|uniref:protein phosphatase CheZ n=1 Tax=Azospirillum sp. TaxID=34012 RepID=UPI003D7363E7
MTDDSLLELSEQDYLKMEEALSQTSRGRAFLRMRDRRVRLVAVDEFHSVARLLEQQVRRLASGEAAPRAVAPAAEGQLARIQEELNALRGFVDQARGDMAALRPADGGSDPILAATAELDAIVQSTERATTEILDATDVIQDYASRIPRDDPDWAELGNGIETQLLEIMTACSFQDITGQRTTKVINTLRYIEERVNAMIEVWGVQRPGAPVPDVAAAHRKLHDTRPDAHLLNGPQLEGQGVSQDDIDALFDGMATENPAVLSRAEDAPAAAPPPKPKPAAKKPPPPPPPPPPAPPAAAEPAGGGASISQDDIDALFA